MSISFLTTKFYIPSPPREFVSRPRLIELLNVGLHRKLTLISASAGFGKTTVLSEWIHRGNDESPVQSQVAWLSLDDDDNDSIRFWSYFIAALQTIRPGMGKSCLALLDSPDPPPVRSILTILINALNAQSDTIVIILDDYHSITAKSIHETLTFFLDHSPPQVHLVIASRIDPPLPLSRLRGKGQLNELRTTELRFNVDETTAFLNEIMKLDLSENDVMALESRVEGWIASLQMTALSLQGRKNIPDFIKAFSGSHHYIMDYLAKEVLQRQDEETRSFLLKTSTLNLLCGPLCDALTHQNDGQERLEDLASANLFLTPSDDERRWFRYHHLFADLLRSQLNRLHPDWVVPLQQEASEWFEREGMVAEAIHHSLAIPDYERAATLIESIAVQTINESRLIAPRSWLAKLPNELVLTRPWLCLSMATVRLATGK
ncbi:MAG: helix-turn-helix transcriptional regulator, partial [Chloroflexi bacterium]|nr:helix-turn-helix transcriptional regulator [Chloroflexota bacterium]